VAGVRLNFSAPWQANNKCVGEGQSNPPGIPKQAGDANAPPQMGPAFGGPR
jgi:hypothetical protein